MLEILDGAGRRLGTKDLNSLQLNCPEETCGAFGGFWCAGGDVYYCDKCKAYRFYDERFGTYFLMEKGDLVSAYVDRENKLEDLFFKGPVIGTIVALFSGYIHFECSLKFLKKIGYFEIKGISYPGVGQNRFYPPYI